MRARLSFEERTRGPARHVVIVGGGISGLTAAFYLVKDPSLRVTVIERSDRFGGTLRTLRSGEFSIEAAADTFDGSRPEGLELCRELGLMSGLIQSEPSLKNLSICSGRTTFPAPLSAGILVNGALDFRAKARMMLSSWLSRKIPEKDESLETFLRGKFGSRFMAQVAGPLIRGVIMAAPGELSAREYFPTRKRGNRPGGKAWTLQGGMDRLLTALVESLQKNTTLRLRAAVRAVARENSWKMTLESGEILEADAVCLALPACRSADLIREAAPELSLALSGIRYDPVAVVNLIFRLDDVPPQWRSPGFIVPGPKERWPFSCLKWVGADPSGSWMRAKAFISGVLHQKTYDLSDEEITEKIIAIIKEGWSLPAPVWHIVERYPQSIAQYGPGHRERMAEIERMLQRYPGLYLTGNAFHGFGITDCVRTSKAVADAIGCFTATARH